MEFYENPKVDRIFDIIITALLSIDLLLIIYGISNIKGNDDVTSINTEAVSNLNSSNDTNLLNTVETNDVTVNKKEEVTKLKIDIKGEVNKPGVYELSTGSIVNDAIKAAGGLNKDATTKYINLSKKLQDEMVIYIYNVNDVNKDKEIKYNDCSCDKVDTHDCKDSPIIVNKGSNNNSKNDSINKNVKVSINKGTLKELMTLTGIGESKAKDIISYRESHNGFKTLDELKKVSGIGDASYNKIKDFITL